MRTGCATLTNRATAQEVSATTDCGFAVDIFKGFIAPGTPAVTNATAAAATAGAGTCALSVDGCVTTGNNGAFQGIAVGNVDNDSALDNWLVSSMSLSIAASATSESQSNGPGLPANNLNDVR